LAAFEENSKVSRPSLRQLARFVAFDVNRTIGGGYASMELLRRTFTSRGWLDADGHGLLVAVSRLTPGTNLLAYCVTLGWRAHGLGGSLIALAAASIPGSFVVFLLAATLVRVDRYPAVQALLAIGILAASGLVISSGWALIRPYLTHAWRWRAAIITAVAAASVTLDATPVRTLLVAAVTSALLAERQAQR
jgi:chromate transporter